MDKKRYFLELAYNGSGYHGWQIQANAHTVQEEINLALSKLLRHPVETMGSGRTDTGVHARQQILHFEADEIPDRSDLLKRLNSVLPKDVAVYSLREVKPLGHARFSAISRSYKYYISLRKNPFQERLSWYCLHCRLDIHKMNEAAEILKGYRDFQCFSKVKTAVDNYECEIKEAFWEQKEQHLIFHITANRFLRGMVRAIVGTMVLVGEGKLDMDGFRSVIESRNRSRAGSAAPAHGLYLCAVTYPEDIYQ